MESACRIVFLLRNERSSMSTRDSTQKKCLLVKNDDIYQMIGNYFPKRVKGKWATGVIGNFGPLDFKQMWKLSAVIEPYWEGGIYSLCVLQWDTGWRSANLLFLRKVSLDSAGTLSKHRRALSEQHYQRDGVEELRSDFFLLEKMFNRTAPPLRLLVGERNPWCDEKDMSS